MVFPMILLQEGENTTTSLAKCLAPALHLITYYLVMFTPTERNYDIYQQELLAIIKSLMHWRLPGLDARTIHHPYRPSQPSILGVPKEP
jgi:hypothetical protein